LLRGLRHRLNIRPTKKPDVFVTPGFGSQRQIAAKRHKRSGSGRELSCSDRCRTAANVFSRCAQ